MQFLLLRQAALLIGCAAAAYKDARTGIIPNWITYPMIVLGIALNAVELNAMLFSIGIATFALGYLLYYGGKIGGGDVKLFTGIALLLPFLSSSVFLLDALFVAALLAVTFYSIFYLLKLARKGISMQENRRGIARSIIFAIIIAAYFWYVVFIGLIKVQAIIMLAIPLALALLFIAFEKSIKKNFFLKTVKLAELEEDEVIAAEFLSEKLRRELNVAVKGVLGKKEIEKLRRRGISSVPVYRNMPPFAPFVLIGAIIVFYYPGIISMLFLAY